jgi:hypothetical protein
MVVCHTLWITLVTTPQISKAMSGLISMGTYLSFSGSRNGFPDLIVRRLTVRSPSNMAMTIFLSTTFRDLSTIRISPLNIPALIMDSLLTRTKNVAAGCLIRCCSGQGCLLCNHRPGKESLLQWMSCKEAG